MVNLCSAKRTVTIWDTSSHTRLALVQHDRYVDSIALSPDDRFIAIGRQGMNVIIESLAHVVVSLPKSDDSKITDRQPLCEDLYAAGDMEDAGKSLLSLIDIFDSEVYASNATIGWVADFSRRCLATSKSDNGMSSGTTRHDDVPTSRVTLTTSLSLLKEWAKTILMISPWTDDLTATADFAVPRRMIYRAICERLESMDHTLQAGGCFQQMVNELGWKADMADELKNWMHDFKHRCCEKLENVGDALVHAQRHDEAIIYYSSTLSLDPLERRELFVKRSKARMERELWEDALNNAIALDASSLSGYEIKYAALCAVRRHGDAADTLETFLSKMAQSTDPAIRERANQYISPSTVRTAIRKIVQRTLRRMPRVLINISTGRLCDRAQQASAFESLPLFDELVASMTTRIDRSRIKREVRQYFRYVMLSHKWEENEPLFQQVIDTMVYCLGKSATHDKLKMFCKIVRDAGFHWAWSDTCCIDKRDYFVLGEALVAMFKWYRGSAMTIVFLRGVRHPAKLGDLVRSIWNTRAWTFQEYVAARVVRFYTEDWTLYLDLEMPNHKESPEIMSEMEQATGVSAQVLMGLRPGLNGIREKLRLASMRQTMLIEDAAYSLFGILSVTGLPPVYGEGENALGRLLAQVLPGSGDVSILAWTGQSSGYNSCLPARITVYHRPATLHLPSPPEDTELERTVDALRTSSLDLDVAVELYDRLNGLPEPWFAGNRLKLSCITFKLPPLSSHRTSSGRVYRVETTAFGTVEFKTRQDLSRLRSLYLVHPWLGAVLDREDVHGGVFAEDGNVESSPRLDDEDLFEEEDDGVELSPENTDDEDVSGGETDIDASTLGEPEMPSRSRAAPVDPVPVDRETRALRLVARLRRPFGALLFALTPAPCQRAMVYKRVAADSLITVRLQASASLTDLLENVRTLDVL